MSLMLMESIWDYFVSIGTWVLISAVLIMVAARTLTLIVKISIAGMKNPVDSLRYE